jgi:predicted ATPase/class 3 adenylate cyclase
VRNLIPHFIQDQFRLNKVNGNFRAFTMFIDLKGFTPMTQSFMKQGTTGAEQLSYILNRIFTPMVSLVYNKKGFIPYFAGDAFTAIFPIEDAVITPKSFLQTAQQMRDLFAEGGLGKTQMGDFQFGIKIGISFGDVEWGIVGKKHKTYYFRGEAIDNCAECEHHAEEQDIVLDDSIKNKFSDSSLKVKNIDESYYRLLEDLPLEETSSELVVLPNLSYDVINNFLPESVIEFDQIGEFRNVVSVFISFEGIDDHTLLNKFSTIVLNSINSFSGYFKEIDFGDKGGVILGFFGAPISFENNTERALEFVLALENDLQEMIESNLKYRIGLTSGLAFTGIIGGRERCQYAAVGNRVNLGARLMIYAKWGEILADENIQKSRQFNFKHIGDTRYKGIESDIPTYRLIGRNVEDKTEFSGEMIGRDDELKTLINLAKPIFENRFAGVVYVYGEAGIGKTRLSFELKQTLKKIDSFNWFVCQADQILKKPFNPFVYFLKTYFEQSSEISFKKNVKNFEERFNRLLKNIEQIEHPQAREIQSELSRTKSVLAAQIGITYPNSLWELLDARGRYANTFTALQNLFKAESLIQPLVIELEDGHWFDSDSIGFLKDFSRQMNQNPIFIIVTSRYFDDGQKPKLIDEKLVLKNDIPTTEIDLNILQEDALKKFAKARLNGDVEEELNELLFRTTSGNPFYAEQILEYFSESNLLQKNNGKWNIKDHSIKMTSSINSILMARIDRLSSLVKETVKAAAVIGREFEVPVLNEVMMENQTFSETNGNAQVLLKEQIQTAEQGQIWKEMNELRYIFKHSLLRETVYEMQLGTRLRELHKQIAGAIEKLYPENIEERFVDLAFHYGQAEVEDKTNEYLEKAADYARRNYQNQQALDFYNKLLKNINGKEDHNTMVRTLLKKGSVLQLIGRWDDCEKVHSEALEIARTLDDQLLLGKTNNSLGHLLMLKGNYEEAHQFLELASSFFEVTKNDFGIVNVYGNLGNLYFRQGRYDEAKAFFTKSIHLSQSIKYSNFTAQITANLGLTHMNQGNYDEGIKCQLEGLKYSEQVNDTQGLATLHTNVGIVYYEKGDYDAALKHYKKGLEYSTELGNKLLTSIAIGCIGSVYQKKGDFKKAMDNFVKDLEICEQLGDKQGIAIAVGLIGELRSIEGHFETSNQYLEKAFHLSEELGYLKGVAKAVNTLADNFTFQKKYDKAVEFYDRAIEVSRSINNRLVLCFSLVEKANVLIEQKRFEEATKLSREAIEMASELGNPELLFEAVILSTKVAFNNGDKKIAIETLEDLLYEAENEKDLADTYYELYQMQPHQNIHRDKALELYQKLYKSMPRFIFKERMDELRRN